MKSEIDLAAVRTIIVIHALSATILVQIAQQLWIFDEFGDFRWGRKIRFVTDMQQLRYISIVRFS